MFKMIPINKIKLDENVRVTVDENKIKDLAFSILQHGMLQPIGVKEHKNGEEMTYSVVYGKRRFLAAKLLNFKDVRAIITHADASSILQLVENIQRESLNPIDEAIAIRGILDSKEMTGVDLSKILGISESQVSNTLRLLKLPEVVIKMVIDKDSGITRGHAKVLMQVKEEKEQIRLANLILKDKLSVSGLSKMVPRIKTDTNEKTSKEFLDKLSKFNKIATSDKLVIPDNMKEEIRKEIEALQRLIGDGAKSSSKANG